jgi:glycosyltransferase involved in cell wall biosynthesis
MEIKSLPKIIIFIDWFLPGYKAGGPIQSVANLVNVFHKEFDVSIVTSDRDLGDKHSYENILLNTWIQNDNYRVIYLSPTNRTFAQYHSIISSAKFKAIYFNSLFSVSFTLKPLLTARKYDIKIVLAPRGMLGKGALLIKAKKKHLFLRLSSFLGIFKNIIWHATAETEKQEILKHFGNNARILIAPNLTSMKLSTNVIRVKKDGEVNIFFISRIAEKKNLIGALGFLSKISPEVIVDFYIIGFIDEEEYWEKCKIAIQNLPINIHVHYLGAIPNNELYMLIPKYHFLLLPTFHENYGHVIIESLQYGCPVIISNTTPWTLNTDPLPLLSEDQEYDSVQPGWSLNLNKTDDFVQVLNYCAYMKQDEYNDMSQKAFDYAKSVLADESVINSTRRLFE